MFINASHIFISQNNPSYLEMYEELEKLTEKNSR